MVIRDQVLINNHGAIEEEEIEATTNIPCSTWKLYENPFYHSPHHHHQYRCRHLLSHPKRIAAANCLWDLPIIMDFELDIARAQITELKAELEFERKIRKKVEFLSRKLTKELSEETKRREAIENVCENLAEEIALDKAEISRMKREMEEERKMLRMAEVFREERVQMKLTEAKLLLEEKLSELQELSTKVEEASPVMKRELTTSIDHDDDDFTMMMMMMSASSYDDKYHSSNCNNGCGSCGPVRSTSSKRRASPEAENPHIKRGIKGFVEFPRVVRAISSSRGRQLGSKLECQKAQLRLLVRHKSPIRSHNLIMG